MHYHRRGGYCSAEFCARNPRIKEVVEQLVNGFLPVSREQFALIHDSLIASNDEFFVLKDLPDYLQTQKLLGQTFRDRRHWLEMSIKNIAHAGCFSSDLTIANYAAEIWKVNRFSKEKSAIGS